MLAVEVILIIIGIVLIIGSFYVTERLSQQDLEYISLMSENDLKFISEKQVKEVKKQVENSVEEIIDESLEITQRGLERETNNKIMAVSEYSDTVLENINKSHNEIMFLYSMLNDKQAETAEMVGELQRYIKEIRDFDLEHVLEKLEEQPKPKTTRAKSTSKPKTKKKVEELVVEEKAEEPFEVLEAETIEDVVMPEDKAEAVLNKNEKILLLYKEGKNEVEIAKALDCGLGEVRLVLGLYHEA